MRIMRWLSNQKQKIMVGPWAVVQFFIFSLFFQAQVRWVGEKELQFFFFKKNQYQLMHYK